MESIDLKDNLLKSCGFKDIEIVSIKDHHISFKTSSKIKIIKSKLVIFCSVDGKIIDTGCRNNNIDIYVLAQNGDKRHAIHLSKLNTPKLTKHVDVYTETKLKCQLVITDNNMRHVYHLFGRDFNYKIILKPKYDVLVSI